MINSTSYRNATTPKPAHTPGGYPTDNTVILPSNPKSRGLWLVGHVVVGLLMVLAVLTPMGYNLPVYPVEFSTPISVWWNVDPKVKGSGNPEMVVPTYFFLGSVVPVTIGAVLLAYIRAKSAVFVPPFSALLHRKPKVFKHLVSYGELLFLLLLVVGNVIVFLYQYKKRSKPTDNATTQIRVIGTSLGFSGLYNMVFLALPASRHSFWMEWLNIPYANGVKYHRWLGVATIVSFVVHTGFYVVFYARTDNLLKMLPCFDCDVAVGGKTNWEGFFGWLSMICMIVMGTTSLPYIRRHYYSVFYATHFLFIPATLFAILHRGSIFYFLFTSMVLYMVNRMLSTASITTPVALKRAAVLSSEVVEITFECVTGYSPGDAVWIKVPALSKTQWHPFSVASTPLETPGLLTIYVKSLGKWSAGLHHYIRECHEKNVQPIIYMDGGYTATAPISAAHSDVVFVGGGIGITPLMGQLVHVLRSHPSQNVWLVWNVRRKDMLVHFQSWLRHIQNVGGDRLRIRLQVTQEEVTEFGVASTDDIQSGQTFTGQQSLPRCFEGHGPNSAVEFRPYAHVSTIKRMVMLTLGFGFSCALVAIATYANRLTTATSAQWILLRVVQFCVAVVGCYLALLVTKFPKTLIPSSNDVIDHHDKAAMSSDGVAKHFEVQSGRADLSEIFQTVESGAQGSVAVYVCGPKSLIRSVDENAHGKFQVHHEDFEM
ncbi:hypothetical protein DYB26_001610 [Aphanomyces astaci]|uniref:FAD-binding FR-type domain-containing protein n=2 Tax=Aphanomyces astaci TaxID=112090 RepID=A0A397FE95_APHAT|nr:hypothetical protein DYB26_001610 [Aphanomyces astaci]RHZ21171.1 hypothetical protein DYB31_003428 [Aphanomyces astaci]